MLRRLALGSLLLLCACKAELATGSMTDGGASSPDSSSSQTVFDAAPDGPVVLGAWGTPTAIPGASSAVAEDDCTLSSNKLELYFKRNDGANGANNLYVMKRADVTSAWGAPTALGVLNSSVDEESPRLSNDDLTLYFGRNGDIYKSTRASTAATWSAASPVAGLNTANYEKWAAVCPGGYAIVSRANGSNDQDLYEGTEAGATTLLTAFNTTSAEQGTLLTSDCLRVYFQSNRDGQFNLYMASRLATNVAWSNPTSMTDFNTTTYSEEDPWISPDQRVFVYASNANGNKDLYISTR